MVQDAVADFLRKGLKGRANGTIARSSTRISRRCGSAIALKTSDVVAARAMDAIICRYWHASNRRNQAGDELAVLEYRAGTD
jgi:hypothetical protein